MAKPESAEPLSVTYPEGSLYEDVITKRVWMLQIAPENLRCTVVLTPYEATQKGEVLEIQSAVFIASKRFKRVPAEALVMNKDGCFIHMDEEILGITFGGIDSYVDGQEAESLGNVLNFTPRAGSAHTQAAVPVVAMDYNPLTRVEEMRDRLTEIARSHRNILVETETLLATLADFERDFKAQLGLPVSDI